MSTSPIYNSTVQPSPFFSLPIEIRTDIYRLLLRRDEPIPSKLPYRPKLGFSSSILRTCRQVLSEARIILYSENTFSLDISHGIGRAQVQFPRCSHFRHASRIFGPRLLEIRRFDVSLEQLNKQNYLDLKEAVRHVCSVLSSLSSVDYLSLQLLESRFTPLRDYRVLESFTMLRNVKSVVIKGVHPVYSRYLTSKLTGSPPMDHLSGMYDVLKDYARPFEGTERRLRDAWTAVENDDVIRVKELRNEIIAVVTEHMAVVMSARDHLFDHDAIITQPTVAHSANIGDAHLIEARQNLYLQ